MSNKPHVKYRQNQLSIYGLLSTSIVTIWTAYATITALTYLVCVKLWLFFRVLKNNVLFE